MNKINDRFEYILKEVANKRVLHLGCTDAPYTEERLKNGTLLHNAIEKTATVQYGIDLDAEGITTLKNNGYGNLAVADVEELRSRKLFGNVTFDAIIAGEIIEHLSNPGRFLDEIKSLMTPETRLVITTVNAYCARRFVYSLVRGYETVHPDHVFYYSKSTLTGLMRRHGFSIEDFSFYSVEKYHEKLLNQGSRRLLWWVDKIANRFAPQLADGVMVVCKLG